MHTHDKSIWLSPRSGFIVLMIILFLKKQEMGWKLLILKKKITKLWEFYRASSNKSWKLEIVMFYIMVPCLPPFPSLSSWRSGKCTGLVRKLRCLHSLFPRVNLLTRGTDIDWTHVSETMLSFLHTLSHLVFIKVLFDSLHFTDEKTGYGKWTSLPKIS